MDSQSVTIILGALGLGAGALKLAQIIVRHNGKPQSSGQLSPEIWEQKIGLIVRENSNDRIIPLLAELKKIAEQQVQIQQKQNDILVELVTASRIDRA